MMAKIVVRVKDPANTYTAGDKIITGFTPQEVEATKEIMLAIKNGLLKHEKNVLPDEKPSQLNRAAGRKDSSASDDAEESKERSSSKKKS